MESSLVTRFRVSSSVSVPDRSESTPASTSVSDWSKLWSMEFCTAVDTLPVTMVPMAFFFSFTA